MGITGVSTAKTLNSKYDANSDVVEPRTAQRFLFWRSSLAQTRVPSFLVGVGDLWDEGLRDILFINCRVSMLNVKENSA